MGTRCRIAVTLAVASMCSSVAFSGPATGDAVAERGRAASKERHAWVYPGDKAAIHPEMYGVNNEWNRVTSGEFSGFNAKLHSLGYRMLRFPGGWEAEHYDWATNRTPGWRKSPRRPGANATQAKRAVREPAFVVKTEPYISNPSPATLHALKNQAHNLVRAHGDRVKHWLIGNEWWLQRGGGVGRPKKLRRYVRVARAIAQEMKAADPAVNVYVTGDWTRPWEFGWMRKGFEATSGWRHVDGVDLHVYAGDDGSATDYRHIARNLGAIKSKTGKSKIFVSEWAATKRNSVGTKRALRSVNTMVLLMHNLIRAGATSATYWPALDTAQGIGLVEKVGGLYKELPHGQAFRWMAKGMTGYSVATTGSPRTAASHNPGNKTVTVLIPSQQSADLPVTVHLANKKEYDLAKVVSAHAMWMRDPDQVNQAANITRIPITDFDAANNTVTVTANPGIAGRGSSYELIKLVVGYR